jgi:glyoxylase-like metal-dependent hydrolase (beta-lactamase superfamily II)
MTLRSFTVNPFAENTYIAHDAGEAVVIDPGYQGAAERALALDYLREHDLKIERLLLTHGHIDHIIDCAYWADTYGMEFEMHEADVPLIRLARQQATLFGVDLHDPPIPTRFLAEGDRIEFGETSWLVIEAPGHSPGSICFYDEFEGTLIAGDVLFQGSIGRTDLLQGSMETLLDSIRSRLFALPDDTTVHPGHGPPTTIGQERRFNPFLQG